MLFFIVTKSYRILGSVSQYSQYNVYVYKIRVALREIHKKKFDRTSLKNLKSYFLSIPEEKFALLLVQK